METGKLEGRYVVLATHTVLECKLEGSTVSQSTGKSPVSTYNAINAHIDNLSVSVYLRLVVGRVTLGARAAGVDRVMISIGGLLHASESETPHPIGNPRQVYEVEITRKTGRQPDKSDKSDKSDSQTAGQQDR